MIEPERLVELNDAPERAGDYVLYWMQQSQRADFNPALEAAIGLANQRKLPVLVGFGLTDDYPEANARHYAFMLQGLAETEANLHARGVGFVIRRSAPDAAAIRLGQRAALIVCDRGYLRPQKAWRRSVAAHANRRVLQVEGDVVVPLDLASSRQEIGARTVRPKILRRREDFISVLHKTAVLVRADRLDIQTEADLSDIPALLAGLKIDQGVGPVTEFRGGSSEARRRLRRFVDDELDDYVEARARLGDPKVSTLSPYLHFGQISPVEIALAARQAVVGHEALASFLEELIVRRELSMNFVNQAENYDSYECLPEWARRTLADHRHDRREHIYDYDQLACAETHDPYWNAAMGEMLATGYMHNHMRMYWGKKVLEWSASPEEAYAVLLRLNNSWFIDGRDANSFASVAWVFGLHDRPWPERPVFGNVRYMNAAGLKRKTDIDAYVERVETLTGATASSQKLER